MLIIPMNPFQMTQIDVSEIVSLTVILKIAVLDLSCQGISASQTQLAMLEDIWVLYATK